MIRYFALHPTIANLLMLGLLALGLANIGSIKRETFPEFAPLYVMATVVYPGASPQEAEETLCLRMEDAVDGLSGIEETKCEAVEGAATLTVKLEPDADMGRMLVDVRTEIDAIKDFPDQIEPPVVKELNWAEPVVDIAISANTSWPHLKAYAEELKRRLKIDADVKLVEVSGFSDHQLRVELNEIDIRRLGLSVSDIAHTVSRQNFKLPSGNIETDEKNFLIRFDEQKTSPVELAKTIISSREDGSVVRLGDIATISDVFELDEEKILFNDRPAAILKISKNKADDALRIKSRVQAFIQNEQLHAPQGVHLTLTNDMSSLLSDRLAMMLKNGWQGILLVFAVMWLFFSLRYSFWVSAGLPVAFMGGLFLMSAFGLSINIMSLVALLMAIGIMMDDAIVIAESIASHLERGNQMKQAIVNGVNKVAPGVISSFLTTIFIFGSLLFMEGQMGSVMRVIPMVLIMVLSISLIEAFLILPSHLYHSLNQQNQDQRPPVWKQRFNQRFEQFRVEKLVPAVRWVIRWRYAAIGATFGLLLVSISLVTSGLIKFVGFPELDGDIAEARIILPPGTTLSQTEHIVAHIISTGKQSAQKLSEQNQEPQNLIHDVTAQYNFNADSGEQGPHIATVRLDLLSAEIRKTLIDDFLHEWRTTTGELALPLSMVFKQPQMGPAGRAIEIRLQHDNLDTLKAASVSLQRFLSDFSGVTGILDDMRPGKEEAVVSLRPGAETFGVDGETIASQLRAAYFGQIADEIQIGPENIEVQVQLNRKQAGSIADFTNFPIMLADNTQIPLAAVANINFQRNYVRIQRINGLRTVTVMADIETRKANTTEVLAMVRNQFMPELIANTPGLRVDYEGEAKENAKTGSSLAKGFLIGLFGLFAILSFQFRSYLEPVIVMLAIPLALIGVLFGHLLLGFNLSMPSILGFISLAGIVVNDSILLVQYIRMHIDQGDTVHNAVVNASKERFRAVFLTSLTTAAGLLPLLLETSLQAQVVQPIVVSIVFGIFASTLLVLFIIPAAYAVLADFNKVHKHSEL